MADLGNISTSFLSFENFIRTVKKKYIKLMLDERCAQTELTADVITYKKSVMFFVLPYRREEKKTCYAAATYVYIM